MPTDLNRGRGNSPVKYQVDPGHADRPEPDSSRWGQTEPGGDVPDTALFRRAGEAGQPSEHSAAADVATEGLGARGAGRPFTPPPRKAPQRRAKSHEWAFSL